MCLVLINTVYYTFTIEQNIYSIFSLFCAVAIEQISVSVNVKTIIHNISPENKFETIHFSKLEFELYSKCEKKYGLLLSFYCS